MLNKSLQTKLQDGIDNRVNSVKLPGKRGLFKRLGAVATLGAGVVIGACGTPPIEQVKGNSMTQGAGGPDQPADSPIAAGFKSLDDYLAWLRQTQEPVDGPWYEEIRPGLYQLRTGNLRILGPSGDETPQGQTFTRAELEKKFGFSQ